MLKQQEVSKELNKEMANMDISRLLSAGKRLTIPQKFLQSAIANLNNPCLFYKQGHTFGFVTYKRLLNLVENLTMSLKQLGVKQGDRVAILSENRPELVVSDISVLSLSAISVPLHITLSSSQIREMIYELEPKIVIVSEKRLLSKLIEIKKDIDRNVLIFYYNIDLKENLSEFKNDRCHFVEALKMNPHKNFSLQYRQLIVDSDTRDTACIIYTLRPNGKYLGAELSHDNLISNYENTYEAFPVGPKDKLLSVLPLSHAFERTAGYYLPILSGSSIVYPSNIASMVQVMREHKPTVVMGVPYIYEKISKRIIKKASDGKLHGLIFNSGLNFALENKDKKKLRYKVYDRMIYGKVRNALGGNIRALISGGAPLNDHIAKFFEACNIPILEGYGMTELSPIVSFNREKNNKVGTVGVPLSDVKLKIANDGEILVKSPGIMKGYYKDGVDTRASFEDGWFKTGDIGEIDNDGFLKITGLKKDLIVLSTGKKVSPRAIEEKLIESDYIKEASVYSRNMKTLEAKIIPVNENLKEKFKLIDINLSENNEINVFIKNEIDSLLRCFASYEQIQNFFLTHV